MFRKHFRFKRMLLGLAFAALAVPVAPAAAASLSTFVDGGPAPVSGVIVSSGHEIRSEHSQSVATLTGLQADGLRLTAMAQRYQQLQPSVAFSERSYGVPGPDPSLVPQVITTSSSSFDWTDAGIGASTAFLAALLLGIGIVVTRRNQHHTGLTSA